METVNVYNILSFVPGYYSLRVCSVSLELDLIGSRYGAGTELVGMGAVGSV
ncbi:hypothetical protein [Bacteroides rodentium]|uniref:hypothetical protein n=1 Tax=Bacteroides rodentium TaxID=691816 RepID=UPI000AD57D62|nr:hypothetical protein [Bacteroides rodentium]